MPDSPVAGKSLPDLLQQVAQSPPLPGLSVQEFLEHFRHQSGIVSYPDPSRLHLTVEMTLRSAFGKMLHRMGIPDLGISPSTALLAPPSARAFLPVPALGLSFSVHDQVLRQACSTLEELQSCLEHFVRLQDSDAELQVEGVVLTEPAAAAVGGGGSGQQLSVAGRDLVASSMVLFHVCNQSLLIKNDDPAHFTSWIPRPHAGYDPAGFILGCAMRLGKPIGISIGVDEDSQRPCLSLRPKRGRKLVIPLKELIVTGRGGGGELDVHAVTAVIGGGRTSVVGNEIVDIGSSSEEGRHYHQTLRKVMLA